MIGISLLLKLMRLLLQFLALIYGSCSILLLWRSFSHPHAAVYAFLMLATATGITLGLPQRAPAGRPRAPIGTQSAGASGFGAKLSRRERPRLHKMARRGRLVTAIAVAGWLGFTLGMDTSLSLAQIRQAGEDGFLGALLDPLAGFMSGLTGGAQT